MTIAILGAGMAGTAAADALAAAGRDCVIYEAKSHGGGHTHSTSDGGFVFDEGPHVSFTPDEKVRETFARGAMAAGGGVEEFAAKITNAFQGHWLTHPAQCHLYGLDPALIAACIADFERAQQSPPPINNYADWCVAMFGRTFAETFPFAYTRKYWTVEAAEMTTDWVGPRIYPPKLEEVVRGSREPSLTGDFHYLKKFRYPARGGYQSFMRAMERPELLRLNKRLTGLDLAAKRLTFADGTTEEFERLISTLPLPDLIRAVKPGQVPDAVRAAAEQLLCSSLVLVDVAVNRRELFGHHWFYVYDEEISFARGHFPHMLAPANAPDGQGAIQLEVYHSRMKPLTQSPESLPARVVDELVQLKILRNPGEVLWTRQREIPFANVIFDHARTPALAVIQPWLAANGILTAGRYGEWGYHWTDDATKAGWAAAEKILSAA
jgi:protoporphyrinogen oxidase